MKFYVTLRLLMLFVLLHALDVSATDDSKPWQQQFTIKSSYFDKKNKILILNVEQGCGNAKTTNFIFKDFNINPTTGEQEISLELWSDNSAKANCFHQVKLLPLDYPNLITKKPMKIIVKGLKGQTEQNYHVDFKSKPMNLGERGYFKKFNK